MVSLPFVPGFPAYSGPFSVGSLAVETPVSELTGTSPCPDDQISTVSFRLFYPCDRQHKKYELVSWIEEPQHEHVAAFARFLGASNGLSNALSYIPNLLYLTKVPVLKNSPLLSPPSSDGRRWPVAIFSHGLGGSQNSYSHLCGSLASHGIVVIAAEHRDGSSPLSIIRDANSKPVHRVAYRSISHTASREVHDARFEQLRIRSWELGGIYLAITKLGGGSTISNFSKDVKESTRSHSLMTMFSSKLDLSPGNVTWIGHSFGAATVCQFVKTIFWHKAESSPGSYMTLFEPGNESEISKQVTPDSTTVLLDPWGLPLTNPRTEWLNNKPLPGYMRENEAGRNILAVLSEAFFRWNANLKTVKKVLSVDPTQERQTQPKDTGARIFYPAKAAHLSQSDFGILFPTLIKLALKAEEPERLMRLNVRAILEVMRLNGIPVAITSDEDMEKPISDKTPNQEVQRKTGPWDLEILKAEGSVRGWTALEVASETHVQEGMDTKTSAAVEPTEAAVRGSM